MNLYASVRDENGDIRIIRDSDYKTKREFKETLSMNGYKIRFVCVDDEDIIEYEAEKYEYKLQKARENAKYRREWLKTNHTETVENAELNENTNTIDNNKKLQKDRYFYIKDVECTTTISYITRKELLELLDNILNNRYDTYEFMENEGACFHIIYKDGTEDIIDMFYDGHKIKKINIASIVYTDATENLVYGNFEVSECGSVSASLTEKIDNTNVVEVNREYKFETLEITESTENSEQVELNENTNTIDNNISELTKSVIELDKLNKSNTIASEKSKEFNALSKNITPNAVDNTIKTNEIQENIYINKLYKEMKIKSIRLSCFIYLVASAIALFSQNFRKIPQHTSGFILGYTVNILGIEFNTQVIDGRIIFIALGRFGFLVNNIYNVYDTVLDVYKCFCEYYSYFTWGYIKLIKKLYKNNEYIQSKKIHDLVFKMNGTYNEKIAKGV